jgi:hypothetical protein
MTLIAMKTDLRHLFGPIRDQGPRPTCLAFAASDLHAALRGTWVPLSCEYVFYHSQRRSGSAPTVGASLSYMLETLRLDGQPAEEGWPYLAKLPANLPDWQPPVIATPIFRRGGEQQTFAVDAIIAHLDQGIPVLMLVYLSRSFFRAPAEGVVDELAGEAPDFNLRHAVVAVAHGAVGPQRVVLVRNSWGEGWGTRGYALLTENFLRPRLFRLAILKEDLSVPVHSVAA